MADTAIRIDHDGPVVRVQLTRPEVRNAFNGEIVAALTGWAVDAAHSPDLRVAVLSGQGPTFSAGADLAWMRAAASYSWDENVRDARAAAEMFEALDRLPVPLIGRVQGAALGGGAGLVAICDMVVAAADATFGFTEVRLGIVPAVIAPYVIAKIGPSASRELFLRGARFDAARAREIGLVHEVVPETELDRAVDARIAEVLAGGPEAIATAKALIRRVAGRAPRDVAQLTAETIAERRASPEGADGLLAFLEKRTPRWSRS